MLLLLHFREIREYSSIKTEILCKTLESIGLLTFGETFYRSPSLDFGWHIKYIFIVNVHILHEPNFSSVINEKLKFIEI